MDSLLDAAVLSRVVRGQAARDPDRVVLVFENGELPAEPVTAGQLAIRSNQVAAEPDVAATIAATGVRTWVVSTPEGRAMGLDWPAEWPVLNAAFSGGEAPD